MSSVEIIDPPRPPVKAINRSRKNSGRQSTLLWRPLGMVRERPDRYEVYEVGVAAGVAAPGISTTGVEPTATTGVA
jgi:hypothetical protein